VIDLESEVIVSAKIYPGDQADGATIFESLSLETIPEKRGVSIVRNAIVL
jgi:hypothetical protein